MLTPAVLVLVGKYCSSIQTTGVVPPLPVWIRTFPIPVSAAAPGAFIIVGVILGIRNYLTRRAAIRAGKFYVPPEESDCGSCGICKIGKIE